MTSSAFVAAFEKQTPRSLAFSGDMQLQLPGVAASFDAWLRSHSGRAVELLSHSRFANDKASGGG